ncbi:MAG: FHA domain-containing protein [Deltaproteobacteria bacterium]|nr:FHA domain-containing protein [Deltaproteobacteria bacterium]
MLRLIIKDAEGGEASFVVEDRMIIGRSRECDIRLSDDKVSRRHARLYRDAERAMIEDMGTPNGTLVNNRPIATITAIASGDTIQIGDQVLRVAEWSGPRDVTASTVRIAEIEVVETHEDRRPSAWEAPISPRGVEARAKGSAMTDDATGRALRESDRMRPWIVVAIGLAGLALMALVALWVAK